MTAKLETITDIKGTKVQDFFCPEGREHSDLARDVVLHCDKAGLRTVGDLAGKSAKELGEAGFPDRAIPYICLQLQRANTDLNLRPSFDGAAGAQGRVPIVSVLVTPDLESSGLRNEQGARGWVRRAADAIRKFEPAEYPLSR